jgi:glutathione S-transferase
MTSVFAGNHGAPARWLYRAALPLVRSKLVSQMQIREPHVAEARKATRAGFDFVAAEVGESGHLVGDRFSVADLAAAALLAPGVEVDHTDMSKPEPKPAPVRAWLDEWKDHPGAAWVRDTYARYRPTRTPQSTDRP